MDAAQAGCRAPPRPAAPARRGQHRTPGAGWAGPGSPPPLSVGSAGTPPGAGRGQPPRDSPWGDQGRGLRPTPTSAPLPRGGPVRGSPRPLVTGPSSAHPGCPSRGLAEDEDVPRGVGGSGAGDDIVAQGPGLGLGFSGCPNRQRARGGPGSAPGASVWVWAIWSPPGPFSVSSALHGVLGGGSGLTAPHSAKTPKKRLSLFTQDVLRCARGDVELTPVGPARPASTGRGKKMPTGPGNCRVPLEGQLQRPYKYFFIPVSFV